MILKSLTFLLLKLTKKDKNNKKRTFLLNLKNKPKYKNKLEIDFTHMPLLMIFYKKSMDFLYNHLLYLKEEVYIQKLDC